MDTRKFDAFSKSLATSASRRSVIGGLFGGALAMAGLSRAAGAPAEKVEICHLDEETGLFHMINVSGNAYDAHMAHGDFPAGKVACEDHQQVSDEGCSCVCKVYETEKPQCYWLSDSTNCWIPTGASSAEDCMFLDSCGPSGGGGSGGGCYAWGTTTEGMHSV